MEWQNFKQLYIEGLYVVKGIIHNTKSYLPLVYFKDSVIPKGNFNSAFGKEKTANRIQEYIRDVCEINAIISLLPPYISFAFEPSLIIFSPS